MAEKFVATKFQAWSGLAMGLAVLYLGVRSIMNCVSTGSLEFTLRHSAVTGPVAAFQVALCSALGIFLLFNAIRQLRKHYVF